MKGQRMNDSELQEGGSGRQAREPAVISFFLIALFWTLSIAILAGWNGYQSYRAVLHEAENDARHNFGKDLAFRRWATRHGGVYVPVDAETPPNPYLAHVPERDIVTPSGRALTLLNPAYMLRQVHVTGDDIFGVRGHITSLRPHRPDNAPDPWERDALQAFERGATERSSLAPVTGTTHLRLMRPLQTEEGCLKCHRAQGYRMGDIIGGISVSIPWAPYRQALRLSLQGTAIGYGGVWLLGLLFIGRGRRKLQLHLERRRQVEQALRQSEARYHSFFQDNQAVILLADAVSSRIIDVNPAACAYYGFDSEEFRRLSLADIDGQPPVQIKAKGRNHFESRHRLANGEFREVEVCSGVLDFTGQQLHYFLVHDITERKQAEAALRQRTKELEERTADLERFTYTVSHDLKSPVVTVKSFLGFLEQDLGSRNDGQITGDIAYIRSAAEKMEELLDELLQLSRIGRRVNPPTCATFQELVQEALTLVAGPLAEHGVEVRLAPVEMTLVGDRPRLVEIWQNLLDNAVKFRGEQAAPRLEIGVETAAETPVFFVRDNGSGIEPAYHERIFGLFERLDTGVKGTGLGLALVKRIVELYGGKIWVESEGGGRGSCFRFTLPAALNEQGGGRN